MKNYTNEELMEIYKSRRKKVADYLSKNKLGAAVFIDSESHRDASIRYLSGHPNDAILIIFENEKNVLIPWDEILSRKIAFVDKIIPYTRYKNQKVQAVKANLNAAKNIKSMKVELPPTIPYPTFLKFVDALPAWDVRCRECGVYQYLQELRMIKDEYEIECIREAARIGDLIIDKIEEDTKNGSLQTESDVALLIEKTLRENGGERTGFDTLAAGPHRSWAIHAFPGYTNAQWASDGLSILDFGVVYNGYTSDTTLTIVKNPSPQQEKLVALVETAAERCLDFYKSGISVWQAEDRAVSLFQASKRNMPHTLGHAIGLEVHEYPRISIKEADDVIFKPGMVITLEPGLYDEALGGVRLENDVLITETGNEVITHSRIIRI